MTVDPVVASVGGERLRFCSVTMEINASLFNTHRMLQYGDYAYAIDDARGDRGR